MCVRGIECASVLQIFILDFYCTEGVVHFIFHFKIDVKYLSVYELLVLLGNLCICTCAMLCKKKTSTRLTNNFLHGSITDIIVGFPDLHILLILPNIALSCYTVK